MDRESLQSEDGSDASDDDNEVQNRPSSSPPRERTAANPAVATVGVITYAPFDPDKQYTGNVMKLSKYTGKWIPRFISLQDLDLSYAVAEGQTYKDTLRIYKVSHGSQLRRDPYALIVEATSAKSKGKTEFVFKCDNTAQTRLWYLRLLRAISSMVPDSIMPQEGMPVAHPRTGLPFVTIPMEHLAVFAPLERLVLHFFSPATFRFIAAGGLSRLSSCPAFVFVGDLYVYACDAQANIKQTVSIRQITGLLTVAAAKNGDGVVLTSPPAKGLMEGLRKMVVSGHSADTIVGVQCAAPDYDMLFDMSPENAELFVSTVTKLYTEFGVPKSLRGSPKAALRRSKLAKEALLLQQLNLNPPEGFELKIRLPMSKRYLLKMVADEVAAGRLITNPELVSLESPDPPPPRQVQEASPLTPRSGDAALKESASRNPLDAVKPPAALQQAASSSSNSRRENPLGSIAVANNGVSSSSPNASSPANGNHSSYVPPQLSSGRFLDNTSDDEDHTPAKARPNAGEMVSPLVAAFGGSGARNRVNGSTLSTTSVVTAADVEKIQTLLSMVGLPQYSAPLADRGVTWDSFRGMDALDLKRCGIVNVEHQIKIENALSNQLLVAQVAMGIPSSNRWDAGSTPSPQPPPPPTGKPGGSSSVAPPLRRRAAVDDDDL